MKEDAGFNDSNFHQVNLNLNVRGLLPSATVSINERSNELRKQGVDIYKLGLGQSPFPVPEPVVEALRRNAHQKDYLPVKGLGELREMIASQHCRTFGSGCSAEDVLIGPGSKELMFLLQLVYYGDLVIPTPTWVSYAPQAKIIGRHIRLLPTTKETDWHPTAEQLERVCREDRGRPRILVLNYPSNPTGRTFTDRQLRDLARVARENRVVLLSDEIYGELHHEGKHQSIVPYYPEGTIFSSGLSKWCGAGGWRLGAFVFPHALRWLLDSMAAVASETYTSTCAPVQYAAVRAFEGGEEIRRYLVHARRVLRVVGGYFALRLLETAIDVFPPEGAFYLFPDFAPYRKRLRSRGIHTGPQLCKRLLEKTGVAILPGSEFGRPARELTARIAYVDFDGAAALAAAQKSPEDQPLEEDFVHENCGRIVEAADRICNWIRSPKYVRAGPVSEDFDED